MVFLKLDLGNGRIARVRAEHISTYFPEAKTDRTWVRVVGCDGEDSELCVCNTADEIDDMLKRAGAFILSLQQTEGEQ